MSAAVTVSAVIPVHNGERYVADAIRSTLNQSLSPTECLIIDDGSTDGTADTIRQFGDEVTYIRQHQSGVSAARNRGAELASGTIVAFLDHDDVWLPAKIERQVEALSGQNATMALSAVGVIDADGTVLQTKRLRVRDDLLTGMLMFDGTETVSCSSTGLVRRAEFLASGGFDPALSMAADWDLLLRTVLGGRLAYVDEPLVLYRVHETNMSHDVGLMERDMTNAFAKAFADPRLPDTLRRRKRRAYGRLYRMLAGSYRDIGARRAMLRALAMSVRHDPAIALELIRQVR